MGKIILIIGVYVARMWSIIRIIGVIGFGHRLNFSSALCTLCNEDKKNYTRYRSGCSQDVEMIKL